MNYQAVIFDLFGTLVDNFIKSEYDAEIAGIAAAVNASPAEFKDSWISMINDRMTGRTGTMENSIRLACERIGLYPAEDMITKAANRRLDYTRRCLVPRPDAIFTLQSLQSAGIKIGLITDCTMEVPSSWSITPFAPFFDVTVFSCMEGVTKPSLDIYRSASRKLEVEPSKCIYVGDGTSRELSGALEVGMHPVLIQGPELELQGFDRTDFSTWNGTTVSCLSEVVQLVGK